MPVNSPYSSGWPQVELRLIAISTSCETWSCSGAAGLSPRRRWLLFEAYSSETVCNGFADPMIVLRQAGCCNVDLPAQERPHEDRAHAGDFGTGGHAVRLRLQRHAAPGRGGQG